VLVSNGSVAGFLTLVRGPLLKEAVCAFSRWPDLLLLNATSRDHSCRGGLALHL
jgi:hypothetical protein